MHDALKRRCLYHWVGYPDAKQELEIVSRKVPGCNDTLARQVVAYVQKLREVDLFKNPGVAETIDWATALTELDRASRSTRKPLPIRSARCSNIRTTFRAFRAARGPRSFPK